MKSIYLIRTIRHHKNGLYHTIAYITELEENDIRHFENIIKISLLEISALEDNRLAFKGFIIKKLMYAFPELIPQEDINEDKYKYWICYK